MDLDQVLTHAVAAAKAGGAELISWQNRFEVKEKGPRDLVTDADAASQRAIQARLLTAFPDHGFLGEEEGASIRPNAEYMWICDPLDGTSNYVHRLPIFCVSLALAHGNEVLCGVIYDPLRDVCYRAIKGRGAWANGRPLKTSRAEQLEQSLVAASFPANVRPGSRELADFCEVVVRSQAVRRLGSSALNLCFVADGAFDAFWASDTKVWDIAAGVLIAQEAGAIVTGLQGDPLNLSRPHVLAAATPKLHRELLGVVGR